MDWLALYLPDLPLDAIADAQLELSPKAGSKLSFGVVDEGKIVALSDQAKAVGAHVGMTLAAASSLSPGLLALGRQPLREAALMQRLAMAVSRFTPWVILEQDGLGLEVSTTSRLFGGHSSLRRQILAATHDAGARRVCDAWASTATAASLLARAPHEDSVSRQDPVSLLALTHKRLDARLIQNLPNTPNRLIDLLHGIGCRTFADLRDLPRRGLIRRGGAELMSLIARAYGDEPDPQTWYQPPPTFDLSIDLMHRANAAPALVHAAQRLVQPLTGWLARHWLAASRVSLELRHETTLRQHDRDTLHQSTLTIDLADPTRDASQIMLLLRERLQRMTLPAPVYAITLRLDEAASHEGRAGAFWTNTDTRRESERTLIDRLSARLGCDAVQRVQLLSDHRPERAMRWVSAQSLDRAARASTASRSAVSSAAPTTPPRVAPNRETGPRPIWLLARPLPLREAAGRPVHLGKPLSIISRAERIESGWFDHDMTCRDYHVAASDDACWWIYRERFAGASTPRWFLHGIFG
jgi:protein ImuB